MFLAPTGVSTQTRGMRCFPKFDFCFPVCLFVLLLATQTSSVTELACAMSASKRPFICGVSVCRAAGDEATIRLPSDSSSRNAWLQLLGLEYESFVNFGGGVSLAHFTPSCLSARSIPDGPCYTLFFIYISFLFSFLFVILRRKARGKKCLLEQRHSSLAGLANNCLRSHFSGEMLSSTR